MKQITIHMSDLSLHQGRTPLSLATEVGRMLQKERGKGWKAIKEKMNKRGRVEKAETENAVSITFEDERGEKYLRAIFQQARL